MSMVLWWEGALAALSAFIVAFFPPFLFLVCLFVTEWACCTFLFVHCFTRAWNFDGNVVNVFSFYCFWRMLIHNCCKLVGQILPGYLFTSFCTILKNLSVYKLSNLSLEEVSFTISIASCSERSLSFGLLASALEDFKFEISLVQLRNSNFFP